MSKKTTIYLYNHTQTDVTFGFYCAPESCETNHQVSNKTETDPPIIYLENSNTSRIIGCWTSKNDLYPTNDNPTVKGYFFADDTYDVHLNTDETITVNHHTDAK